MITAFSPSLALSIGDPEDDSFTGKYEPTFVLFANHTSQNATDHNAQAALQLLFPRPKLNVDAGYQKRSDAIVETGTRTQWDIYTVTANAAYALSERTSLELGARGAVDDYRSYLTSLDVSAHAAVDYAVSDATMLGIEANLGWLAVEESHPRLYEQISVRSVYRAAELLVCSAKAGAEFRETAGAGSQGAFVFDMALDHRPFDSTQVTLTGTRRVEPSSVVSGEDRETFAAALSVRQRFLQRVFVSGIVSYEHTEYESVTGASVPTRRDNTIQLRVGVTTNLTERWVIEGYYLYWRNASSIGSFNFTDNQVGLQSSFSL